MLSTFDHEISYRRTDGEVFYTGKGSEGKSQDTVTPPTMLVG